MNGHFRIVPLPPEPVKAEGKSEPHGDKGCTAPLDFDTHKVFCRVCGHSYFWSDFFIGTH